MPREGWLSWIAEVRCLIIALHLCPIRAFSAKANRILVTHPRLECIPGWVASRAICFLLRDLVSLFPWKHSLKKRKKILAVNKSTGKQLVGRLSRSVKGISFQNLLPLSPRIQRNNDCRSLPSSPANRIIKSPLSEIAVPPGTLPRESHYLKVSSAQGSSFAASQAFFHYYFMSTLCQGHKVDALVVLILQLHDWGSEKSNHLPKVTQQSVQRTTPVSLTVTHSAHVPP